LRILQVHNLYQHAGGEDQVCAAEYELLKGHGHDVTQYFKHNDDIRGMSSSTAAVRATWNQHTYREVRKLIGETRPDILHAHNTFPLVSPALYYAASAEHVPVVQTLHNFRLICPAATLFRDGRVCEDCVGSVMPVSGVLHRCYRRSALASAAVAIMLASHHVANTWTRKVSTYIALTEFARSKFIEGGLPADRISVKPNCLAEDPGVGDGEGGYALFAGRLIEEKGVHTLLTAWRKYPSLPPLKIVGQGNLTPWIKQEMEKLTAVCFLGQLEHEAVIDLMKRASVLIFPSRYYEGLPMAIIEALGCGTPVIASALGSMNELIVDGENGYKFQAGSADDLAEKVTALLSAPGELARMRRSARKAYEDNYGPERNYDLLMDIYKRTIESAKAA